MEEDGPGISPETWAEHQRRQRSIRMLMMFLMMLILMDGEEPHNRKKSMRGSKKPSVKDTNLDRNLWDQRRNLDFMLGHVKREHHRFHRIIDLNGGKDEEANALQWAAANINISDVASVKDNDVQAAKEAFDEFQEEERLIYHYPRNATGSYRGAWTRGRDYGSVPTVIQIPTSLLGIDALADNHTQNQILTSHQLANLVPPSPFVGLHLLPPSTHLDEKEYDNMNHHENRTMPTEQNLVDSLQSDQPLDFSKDEGSIIIRLFTRAITGMQEISLVDGIITLYDVNDRSFTSHMKHLTLRVRGVVIHSLGKISLVANDGPLRSAFIVKDSDGIDARRNLMQTGEQNIGLDINIEDIRNDALQTYGHLYDADVGGEHWKEHLRTDNEEYHGRKLMDVDGTGSSLNVYVGPNPFAPDDEDGTLYTTPSNVLRVSPPITLQNGRDCEFELDFNITEAQWTISEWRAMLKKLMIGMRESDPHNESQAAAKDTKDAKRKKEHPIDLASMIQRDEDVVMHMLGTIHSPQCDFITNVNITAVRTDWEQTTAKAINYCFFMMVACLAQAVFLLRQLIHSQSQSAAVRVSLISVGWQTTLDAILCIEHILLCMLLQPVSTAFGKSWLLLLCTCILLVCF